MKLLKKYSLEIATLPVLICVYLFTRLIAILSIPIFTDEAIYTRWAQIARFDSNWRFISLTDGKQPSFVWLDVLVMKIVDDPLLAGRLVSVGAGFLTVLGVYFLAYELFKKIDTKKARIIGIIASGIVVLFPFSLVYDRLAIYDSLVAAFFVWALYFQIRLVRTLRFDNAMVLGFILGGAVLTKSIGFLSIYLTPFLLLLLEFNKKTFKVRIFKFVIYAGIATVMSYGMYSILRLSPFFHIIAEKNLIFVQSPEEWLKLQHIDKYKTFIGSTRGLIDWFVAYFTIPYIVLVVVSFFINTKLLREKTVLLLWFLLPFLSLCVFGKTLYPRYILFMVMPLMPLVAFSIFFLLERYKSLVIRGVIIGASLITPLYMNYFILFDFSKAPIPRLDLEQYINGWPAGGGVEESVNYFQEQSRKGPIFIATQGTFGLMPAAYEIYFLNNKNITTKGYWPTNEAIPEEIIQIAKEKPTYFVFYQDCQLCSFPGDAPDTWSLEKVASYRKGAGDTYLTIYRVKNE